ncbi:MULTISPECIES: energy-coupling factor transporter ATPase [Gemella]|uniref:energy-coupling factor transporter ATPase n=1 Tax=Gemella TaxID=1378 RepID=UPI000767EF16|nr:MULTISPECIES: energy-coupling factor transporter ATPase [Gemella]AME09059.1 energy-coupling factor transporter ATPase [Gemella sp. oral taxon 928]AXI26631.1 energy-coupling factor transporter ATPase [Gemella sp. ND 6198]
MQISFKNVDYNYNEKTPYERKVLKNINIDIQDGSYTVIVGKTGSGKSTLIEHINGLLVPSTGEVTVGTTVLRQAKNKKERKELAKTLRNLREQVAVLFQFSEQQLFETTVLKDIIFAPLNYGVDERTAINRAKRLINLVGLSEEYLDKSPFELSGGEMRKIALCGVLALKPKTLILDEPTVALDYKSRTEIMKLISKLKEQLNMTIVLVTHNMEYVLEYADKVFVMKKGRVVFSGSAEELFTNKTILTENALELPEVLKMYNKLKNQGIDIGLFPRKYSDLTKGIKLLLERAKDE